MKHPFLVASYPHTLRVFRDLGYETFNDWFNEDYDDIYDDYDRLTAILAEIERIKDTYSIKSLIDIKKDMRLVIDHNYNNYMRFLCYKK